MFPQRIKQGEDRIRNCLKNIKENEVHVIDVARLSEYMQSFVFGNVAKTILDLQNGAFYDEKDINPPKKIVIFIDELNKYASKDVPKNSPILKLVLDIAERGRSLGVVLVGAEQFRSAIHDRITGNCSTHVYGRANSTETSTKDYSHIPTVYKNMINRLKQGECIIQNPLFSSPLKIKFPKPIYKQDK
jgi:DNA helicase HerA-like ATPase